jgi:hypothetical protein
MQILLFTFLMLSALGCAGSTGSEAMTARRCVDLGASPWRFTKVILTNATNLAAGCAVGSSGITLPQTITVDLRQSCALESFKDTFAETRIKGLRYKVEGSNDDVQWEVLHDQTISGTEATPMLEKANAVGATAGTVGFVEQATSASIGSPLSGRYRFVRLVITKCVGGGPPSKHVLEVFGGVGRIEPDGNYAGPKYDDSSWQTVGLPHCFNDMDTYLNANDSHMWRGVAWYRKHLNIRESELAWRHVLEFEGVNLGAAVYVNGKFMRGRSSVTQPGETTHVGGFLPFAVDITDELRQGENIIAVRVSNADKTFFAWPGFGTYEGFGMGWGGIVGPVHLHVTGPVYIPADAATADGTWGTYTGVVQAEDDIARVRAITHVKNALSAAQAVTLTTTLVAPSGSVALSMTETRTIAAGTCGEFDQSGGINNPSLWYPNNSPYGKPQLYRIARTVSVGGKTVDLVEAKCGLRVIDWTGDYCLINGKKHLLLGFGYRNIYPALGSAVPPALQWQDAALIAQTGGNLLRVGHVPATRTMLEACDAYGVLVMQNSGDNEWMLKNQPALSYKGDFDREMMIACRNYASVLLWESNNGLARNGDIYWPSYTKQIANENDFIRPRIIGTRDGYPGKNWNKKDRLLVGYSNTYHKVEDSPSLNLEVYGAVWTGGLSHNISRDDYAHEKEFCTWFINDYLSNINEGRACGWVDWMLAETQGEGYTTYLNGRSKQKSLGSCAMDGNRFPKLKYEIYGHALWVPNETRPGVELQSHWNLAGKQQVCAWSNCRSVELLLNGKSLGVRKPDANNKRCEWQDVVFEPGVLKAVGQDDRGRPVCASVRETAGAPHHLVLRIEPPATHPGGVVFPVRANGSDATIVTATVVDRNGRWCPLADNRLTFMVSGAADYRGSYNFYFTPDKPLGYHAPGDHELAAEGGLMRVAIRSTFSPGKVTVTATSPGLGSGRVFFRVQPM